MKRLVAVALLSPLAILAGCASPPPSTPFLVEVSGPVLAARAESLEDGRTRLLVVRAWTREFEQQVAEWHGVQVAGDPPPQYWGRAWVTGLDKDGANPLAQAFGKLIGESLGDLPREIRHLFGPVEPDRPDFRRFTQLVTEPSLRTTAEGNGVTLALGIQPVEGYLLEEPVVRQLGGPGATVLLRDGVLSVEIVLPARR